MSTKNDSKVIKGKKPIVTNGSNLSGDEDDTQRWEKKWTHKNTLTSMFKKSLIKSNIYYYKKDKHLNFLYF